MTDTPQLYLEALHCSDFRNLRLVGDENFQFHPRLTVILGQNGHGKTNLLEAIFYLLKGKSFRKLTDAAQILSMSADRPRFLVQGRLKIDHKIQTVTHEWDNDIKRVSINGFAVKRFKALPCVIVQPASAFMFFAYAAERREWLDHAIGTANLTFAGRMRKFDKLRHYKSQLIKKGSSLGPLGWKNAEIISQVKYLNQEMSKVSKLIIDERLNFIAQISPKVIHNFQQLFDQRLSISLNLNSKLKSKSEAEILTIYEERWPDEWERKRLIVGPHMDDLTVESQLGEFEKNASMGQQKMAFLSLQFALLSYYVNIFQGISPILLLDDVSSELDSERWKNLIEYLRSYPIQILMTTAREKEDVLPHDSHGYVSIMMRNGRPI
jgi:DNA replication and repair protein RecF